MLFRSVRFAAGNFTASAAGDVSVCGQFTSNGSGNRILLSASDRMIQFISNSGRIVSKLYFFSAGSMDAQPSFEQFQYSSAGLLQAKSIIRPTMFQICNSSGDVISGFGTVDLIMKQLPTADPKIAGYFWRNGTDVRISTG